MVCPNCGAELRNGSHFCSSCGSPIEIDQSAVQGGSLLIKRISQNPEVEVMANLDGKPLCSLRAGEDFSCDIGYGSHRLTFYIFLNRPLDLDFVISSSLDRLVLTIDVNAVSNTVSVIDSNVPSFITPAAPQSPRPSPAPAAQRYVQPAAPRQSGLTCPKCGSSNINIQVMQENLGSTGVTKTKTKTKQVKHGLLYWIFIGSWWWIIDLFIWIFAFIPRALFGLLRKKKYKSTSTTVTTSTNNIRYIKVFTCQNCGKTWKQHS